jgi:hypothetical protein
MALTCKDAGRHAASPAPLSSLTADLPLPLNERARCRERLIQVPHQGGGRGAQVPQGTTGMSPGGRRPLLDDPVPNPVLEPRQSAATQAFSSFPGLDRSRWHACVGASLGTNPLDREFPARQHLPLTRHSMTQLDEAPEEVQATPLCTPCALGVHSCCTTRTRPCQCTSAWHLAWGQVSRRAEHRATHQLPGGAR